VDKAKSVAGNEEVMGMFIKLPEITKSGARARAAGSAADVPGHLRHRQPHLIPKGSSGRTKARGSTLSAIRWIRPSGLIRY
jgi:hypothetical protein